MKVSSSTATINTQIFGDGEQIVIIFKDDGCEFAYQLKKPIITSINVNEQMRETTSYFNSGMIELQQQPITINADMAVERDNFVMHSRNDGKPLLFKLNMFKNVKVSDLFKVINQKLSDRE